LLLKIEVQRDRVFQAIYNNRFVRRSIGISEHSNVLSIGEYQPRRRKRWKKNETQ
jgi:hypothetical protein